MSKESLLVAVFGASGAQGAPVAKRLIEQGISVRSITRNPDGVRQLFGDLVDAHQGDLADLNSLKRALTGVDAVFFHLPFVGVDFTAIPTYFQNFLRAARECSVSRIVFTTSGLTTDNLPPLPAVEGNRMFAKAILTSGISAVILRPTFYLENLLMPQTLDAINTQGKLVYPPVLPDRKLSLTSLGDQAAIAAAALTAPGTECMTFDIASIEAVTGVELASKISKKTGRTVLFEPPTPEQFGHAMGLILGSEVGKYLAAFWEVVNKLPDDGVIIDLQLLQETFPVTLTTVSQWVDQQKWG